MSGSNGCAAASRTEVAREAQQFLDVLHPDGLVEVRGIECTNGNGRPFTASGYFDDHQVATAAIARELDGKAAGVYVTLNVIDPALVARSPNRVTPYAKLTTSDKDVRRRRWLLIDCDPKRPGGVSATEEQVKAAHLKAVAVRRWLSSLGWPDPVEVFSGNGWHLLYPIDLPNDDESTALVKRVLLAVHERFSDDAVSIDTSTFNAARIAKIPGTLARKGHATEDRPHRRARLVFVPGELADGWTTEATVDEELLRMVAGMVETTHGNSGSPGGNGRDSQGWLLGWFAKHGVTYREKRSDLYLVECPFDESHGKGSDTAVVIRSNGAYGFECKHDSCQGRHWRDYREAVEGVPPENAVASPREASTSTKPSEAAGKSGFRGRGDDFRPFPTRFLPEPIRRFVERGAKAIGCDPSYVAMPLLAALGAAIGNTRRLRLKRNWTPPPILWMAVVGDSGTAKSPAFRLALRPLNNRQERAWERYDEALQEYDEKLLRYQRDLKQWQNRKKDSDEPPPEMPVAPVCERCLVDDVTCEGLAPILRDYPRGLLLSCDELSGWIGSFGRYSNGKGSDTAHWLKMFNADRIVIDRKTGTQRTIRVPRAAVSVCGGIQPGILERSLGEEHRENGLAARLLLSYPPRKVKLWTEEDVDPATEEAVERVVDRLYELDFGYDDKGRSKPQLVHLDAEAKQEWLAFYARHAKELAGLEGDLAAAWSKLEETPARLALILHLVRWAAGDAPVSDVGLVDAETMRAAIGLTEWFKREARRVYAMLHQSVEERQRRGLADWIAEKGGTVTAREVQQGRRNLKTAEDAEHVLQDLVEHGFGQWNPSERGTPGRPTRRFVLCRPAPVYETAASPDEGDESVDVDTDEGLVRDPIPLPPGTTPVPPVADHPFVLAGDELVVEGEKAAEHREAIEDSLPPPRET